jgi:protein-disulfide isomerase
MAFQSRNLIACLTHSQLRKIAESNKLAQQYQLTGVPAVVVNGKYVVQGEDGKVTQVINY